jgi:hypothetical protein
MCGANGTTGENSGRIRYPRRAIAAIVGAMVGQVQTADIGKVRRRATRSLAYDEYLRG